MGICVLIWDVLKSYGSSLTHSSVDRNSAGAISPSGTAWKVPLHTVHPRHTICVEVFVNQSTLILTYLLTYSMVQSHSWEAKWFAASVRHLSLSWASPIQSIYPHPTSWRSILILSTHPRLGLPSGPKYTHTGLNAAALLWRRNARLLYRINHLPGDEQQFRLVFPQSVRVFRVFSSFLELKLLLETFYTDLDVFGVFGTWAPGLLRLNFGHYLRDRIWHILTYSMEPSPSWEANWFCN